MKMVGAIVHHNFFGKGTIVNSEGIRITVKFDGIEKEKKFRYPEAFGRYLMFEEVELENAAESLNEMIIKEKKARIDSIDEKIQEVLGKMKDKKGKSKDGSEEMDEAKDEAKDKGKPKKKRKEREV